MTQDNIVLEWLRSGRSITSWEAIQLWKHTRLGASINRLKGLGFKIEGNIETNPETKKHWKRYILIPASALFIFLSLCTSSFAQLKPAFTDEQAIRAVIGEAANQGYQGMYALSCALINRNSLQGVYGAKAKHIAKQPLWVWKMARKAWNDAKNGKDITGGATHWESTNFKKPYWAYSMKETYRYKDHIFYKEIK